MKHAMFWRIWILMAMFWCVYGCIAAYQHHDRVLMVVMWLFAVINLIALILMGEEQQKEDES